MYGTDGFKTAVQQVCVIFFPFILFILLQTILGYTKWNAAGPYTIMQPVQPDLENFGVVVIEIVVLFVVSVGGYVLGGGRKHEAL